MNTYKLEDLVKLDNVTIDFILDQTLKERDLNSFICRYAKRKVSKEGLYERTLLRLRKNIMYSLNAPHPTEGIVVKYSSNNHEVLDIGLLLSMLRYLRFRRPEVYRFVINNEYFVDTSILKKEETSLCYSLRKKYRKLKKCFTKGVK